MYNIEGNLYMCVHNLYSTGPSEHPPSTAAASRRACARVRALPTLPIFHNV